MTSDVVIVGAGIVGAACVRALARDGMRVTIVDAAMIGGGTTAAGMGHVVVMDDNPAQLALTRYSRDLWQELADELPEECEFDSCGTLWVAEDDEELAAAREKQATLRSHGVCAELLDAQQLAEAEPELREGLAGGLVQPDDLVVYPPCVARWLVDQARANGAVVRVDTRVVSLGGDHVLLADGTRLVAGCVVNAAGTAAPRLTPGVPIRPRKGHLVITNRYPGFIRRQLVELGYIKSAAGGAKESVALNVQPRHTGQVLIGSSRQYDIESDEIEAAILGRMLRRAIAFLPGLAGLTAIRTWTGFRPSTEDKLPLIGPWPATPGLYLAAGHEGLGITTSLATGELVADMLAGANRRSPASRIWRREFGKAAAMTDSVTVTVNGSPVQVPACSTAAVALAIAGVAARQSVTGTPRGPLCGMGICFECCATIDGRPHQRTCQAACRPGMEIRTDGDA